MRSIVEIIVIHTFPAATSNSNVLCNPVKKQFVGHLWSF
jgi:hypothetical protein